MNLSEIRQKVEGALSVNLMEPNKKRVIVEGRALFSLMSLLTKNYKLHELGSEINKHHATIIHYQKLAINLITYDKNFREKYILCLRAVSMSEKQIERYIQPKLIQRRIRKRKVKK